MRIVTLIEDASAREDCQSAHGLSLYVESEGHKLLFDLGPDGTYLENAEKLGVDVAAVDLAVVSHGHYDHGGGLAAFLARNARAKVYLQGCAFDEIGVMRAKGYVFAGLDAAFRDHPRVVLCDGAREIAPGLFLFSDIEGQFDSAGNRRLFAKYGADAAPDDFRHEQCLVVRENGKNGKNGKNVLFSGCSHRGVVNIMRKAAEHCGKIDVCIGGFHLLDPVRNRAEPDALVDSVARELLSFGATYYTCHCTGLEAYQRLKLTLGERIAYLSTGDEIVV